MDESEKRKERLRAMRVEAEEVEASHSVSTLAVPGYLSNPLAEDIAAIPGRHESCAPSRFDFYTDPMAAFSSDTKRIKVVNQLATNNPERSNTVGSPMAMFTSPLPGGPRYPEMTAPAAHQFQRNYAPDQRMYQVQGSCQNFGPQRNPTGMERPFPLHHVNPPEVWDGAEGTANYSFPSDPSSECRFPGPGFRAPGISGSGPPGSPGYRSQGTPGFRPQGSPGFRPQGSPGFIPHGIPGFRLEGRPGFGPPGVFRVGPPGSPGFRSLANQGYRPLGSPTSSTGQGRGAWFNRSPSPRSVHGGSPSPSPSSSSRRGGGHWNSSPGSGWRGGRGSSHGRPSMYKQGPEGFYDDSMVEDPWESLKPVIWKGVDTPINRLYTPGSSKSSVANSSNTRNASSAEGSTKFAPQPSLAEYLAASFNEAAHDSPST